MHFGLMFANTLSFAEPAGAALIGPAAEAAGFESLWTVEHVLWPEDYTSEYPYDQSGRMPGTATSPIPDPLIWLTYVAAHTTKIKLATGILIVPQRNPGVLAKEIATLDVLSSGRMVLGIGVGWLEEEFAALGVPFDGRGKRTDEYIDVMRQLWAGEGVSYSGDFVNFENMHSNPKPVNRSIPIVVGGHSKIAARRAGRLGDGFFPGAGNIPELIDIVRQTAADEGRDPTAIEITAPHPAMGGDIGAAVEELESWGVDRTFVPAFMFAFAEDPAAAMAEFGEKIAPYVTK